MKHINVLLILVAFVFASIAAPTTAEPRSKSRPTKSKIHASKVFKKKLIRRPLISTQNYEKKNPKYISDNVIEAITSGDFGGAILAIREERPSPKLVYLNREVSKLNNFNPDEKVSTKEAHKIYQNIAISYHNLYLFLKARDIEQADFYEKAIDYYNKAKIKGPANHKVECDVLTAALIAASGNTNKAKSLFSKVKISKLRDDFESTEYLAAYYSAMGDVENATRELEVAYKINPDELTAWLYLGDDFFKIKDDPMYKALLVAWKAADAEKRLALTLPKNLKPVLSDEDNTSSFRPQKSGKHYDIKKSKKVKSSKKATSKKSKKTTSKKKK